MRHYKRSKSRRQMIFKLADGRTTSMSFARWQMTQHLGRVLLPSEHVDHKNDDPLDDRISNYQLLTPGDNNRKSNLGKPSPLKGIEKGWAHGSMYAWMKKKCACSECEVAKWAWHDARNERRRSVGGGRGPYRKNRN